MLEPLSTLGFCTVAGFTVVGGYTALSAYASSGSAVSSEASQVRTSATQIIEYAERSQVLFGEKADALSRLVALVAECSEEGWDGNDAVAINPMAQLMTGKFLRALPDGVPLPEFTPEPDGAISMDWIESKSRIFSVSVGTSQRLAFAWIDGADRGHGVAGFIGEKVPKKIIEGILATTHSGHASLRAA